jgi:hypothetical protein
VRAHAQKHAPIFLSPIHALARHLRRQVLPPALLRMGRCCCRPSSMRPSARYCSDRTSLCCICG